MPVLDLQFSDPQVQPFYFLDRQQVNFTEEFDDFGLGPVHRGIMWPSQFAGVGGEAVQAGANAPGGS